MIKIVAHLLDDVSRHLSPAWTVEISDWITVVDAFKGWKMFPDLGHGLDHCFRIRHGRQ
jgi:hypothetical protein